MHSGQVCAAGSRIFVQESIYDEFVKNLAGAAKSFKTGKSAQLLGGVPHDVYGMTSLSVRQYVLGIYKQLGLREKDITKVQTGGPGTCILFWRSTNLC